VIEPNCGVDVAIDTQPETLFIVRRRYARNLGLALVASVSALLTVAISLLLAGAAADEDAFETDPASVASSTTPVASARLAPAREF
jgi:hypothetical protein